MAEYYIDYNRGSDLNAGTSKLAPWKSLNKMRSVVLGAGDVVFLANDSEWHEAVEFWHTGNGWGGTEENPTVITLYDSGGGRNAYPIVGHLLDTSPGDWTYDVTRNSWYLLPPYTSAFQWHTHLELGPDKFMGYRHDFPDPLPSVDGAWQNWNDRLYLYAPSSINPIDYYGSIKYAPNRGVFFFHERNAAVVLDRIKVTHGKLCQVNNYTATVRVKVRNCAGYYCGPLLYGVASPENGNKLYLEIEGCVADYGSSAFAGAYDPNSDSSKGIMRFHVRNNTFSRAAQSWVTGCVYIQTTKETIIEGNRMFNVPYGSPINAYEGCGIYVDLGANNVIVRRNIVHDCILGMQLNLTPVTYYESNLIYNCRAGMRINSEWDTMQTVAYMNNNTFANMGVDLNSIYGPIYKSAIYAHDPKVTVIGNNNLFTAAMPGFAAVYTASTGCVDPWQMTNTVIYGFTKTFSTLNDMTPCLIDVGTTTANPLLSSNYKPLPGSPCLTGGADLGYIRDLEGRQCKNHVGAFGYARVL